MCLKIKKGLKKKKMDALRNTLLEWSLTNSPCSNVGAGPGFISAPVDIWGTQQRSEDDGAYSGHLTGETHRTPNWATRRHAHPVSLSRSAAFSSSLRSTHDADAEEYDERQHLREALRSAVGASNVSSRASMELRSSRNSSMKEHSHRPVSFAVRHRDEAEAEMSGFGSDHDGAPPFITLLPTSENDIEEFGAWTSLQALRADTRNGVLHASRPSHAVLATSPTSVVVLSGGTAGDDSDLTAEGGGIPQHAAVPGEAGNRNESGESSRVKSLHDGAGAKPEEASVSGLRLSTTAFQTCHTVAGDCGGGSSSSNVCRSQQPSFAAYKACKNPHTPLPISVPSSESFRLHSSASSGYGVDDERSPCLPSRGQQLLRPSFLLDATSVPPSARNEDSGNTGNGRHPSSRHLVPLREILDDSVQEDEISMSHVSLQPLRADPGVPLTVWEKEKDFGSTMQGISASMANASMASNLPRTSPHTSHAAPTTTIAVTSVATGAGAEAAMTQQQQRLNASMPASPPHTQIRATTSRLSSPTMTPHTKLSPLHYYTQLEPDDHVVAHVLVRPADELISHGKESGPVTAQETREVAAAAVAPVAAEGEAPMAADTTRAAAGTVRRPLLIPQPHRSPKDIHGRSVLLRAHRHFSAVQSHRLQSNSYSHAPVYLRAAPETPEHAPHSLAGVGLSSVPQPFGAYPYQWTVAADQVENGGHWSGSSSLSTAVLRRASSAMSHLSLSNGTVSTATPAGMQRSVSDGQLYANSSIFPPQVSC